MAVRKVSGLATVAVAVALISPFLLEVAPAAAANACIAGFADQGGGVCSRDLVVTSTVETVKVPAGVTTMTFDVRGAEGGTSSSWWNGNGSPGGKGGRELATVPVTPGDTLQLVVGEAGTDANGGHGGFGGGGQPSSNQGGAGGGGSFVFDGAGNPLVVAGGGGGGGFDYNVDNSYATYYATQKAPGGDGAGAGNATDGQSVSFKLDTTFNPPAHYPPGGGGGATTSGPGAGGHSTITPNFVFGQVDGIAGSGPAQGPLPAAPTKAELALYLGAGGNGVKGTCCYYLGHAGGGGGGYYGGGSGGSIEADYEGGGGGGGAGYVVAGASAASAWTGVNAGDGSITVSYKVGGSGGGGKGAITSFSPTSGGIGTVVTISGSNLGTASSVRFNGVAGTAVKNTAGSISAKVPAGATSGLISITTSTGSYTSTGSFTVVAAPTVTGFSPAAGSAGMQVTVTGANLDAVTAVKVGAVSVSPDSTSVGTLTFTIPVGAAASSTIAVSSAGGKATAKAKLSVVPAPSISSISPLTAAVGAKVTVTGTGLAKATSVTINGMAATYKLTGSTLITVTVPAGASTGAIAVTTAGGTATGPSLTLR